MDSAVAFVQAYLYANGYFTVTEYPVVEAMRHGNFRTATDVDILAVRFPGAGRLVPRPGKKGGHRGVTLAQPDAALNPSADRVDLIVAEVKEGKAELNHGARNPEVLRAALTRFGASTAEHADMLVEELIQSGTAHAPMGPQIRLVAFGSHYDQTQHHPYTVITLGHIITFLKDYAKENWEMLRHAQFKDPGTSFLMMLEKAMRSDPDHRR
ncbi:MAG: hypothetical protein CMJ35_01130 [Phycisphaerae bacterium]|nr:hypothetical protein [Phycisphaerae bacterium]MBM90203.1 hypothetical protein [Phycisphaerae bacterium]|tara:strand:- start:131 stop:763 length:633 start_codon:yes stop_codon:yes gene_type:complete